MQADKSKAYIAITYNKCAATMYEVTDNDDEL